MQADSGDTAPVRLGIVTTTLQVGGAERLLQHLVRSWRQDGSDEIQPNCYVLEDGPLRSLLEREGCRVHVAPGGKTRLGPWIAPWLAKKFLADRIQVVHAHLPLAGFHARIAGALCKLPVLYTEHSLRDAHSLANRALNRWTFHLNARVVAVSEAVLQSVRSGLPYPSQKLSTILNGIGRQPYEVKSSVRQRIGLPAEAIVVGSVANLNPRKGLMFLIRALESAMTQNPKVHLCFVGRDDGDRPRLEQAASQRGIASQVHFLGYRPDARTLLAGFDIFALPSLGEGLPLSLLEAMDAGLPAVASAVGGIPEVVQHGVTGFLAASGDVAALAENLDALIRDPMLRVRMGQAAREKVRRDHDICRTAKQYAQLYRLLLNRQ